MDGAVAVLEKAKALGISVTSSGNRILLEPGSKVPAELVQSIRQHKGEILAILTRPKPSGTLWWALAQKNGEIAVMRERLASPYYANDAQYHQWCLDQIGCLTDHITEITRCLREGGTLRLPPCCKDDGQFCLIAMRRLNGCLMSPCECGFSLTTMERKTLITEGLIR